MKVQISRERLSPRERREYGTTGDCGGNGVAAQAVGDVHCDGGELVAISIPFQGRFIACQRHIDILKKD